MLSTDFERQQVHYGMAHEVIAWQRARRRPLFDEICWSIKVAFVAAGGGGRGGHRRIVVIMSAKLGCRAWEARSAWLAAEKGFDEALSGKLVGCAHRIFCARRRPRNEGSRAYPHVADGVRGA